MKTITAIIRCRRILSVLLTITLFPGLPGALWSQTKAKASEEAWQFKTEKDDIRLYSRWTPVSAERKTRELRGVLSVDASIEEILTLLRFEGGADPWLDRCQKAYIFDMSADRQQWFSYAHFALPWPISDQDIVLHNAIADKEEGRSIHIRMNGADDKRPVPRDVNRIQAFSGSWRLQTLPDGKTQIDYRVQTRNKPTIPIWITDPVIQQSFLRTLANLRRAAETRQQKIAQKN